MQPCSTSGKQGYREPIFFNSSFVGSGEGGERPLLQPPSGSIGCEFSVAAVFGIRTL
jgi:hypothetical protein